MSQFFYEPDRQALRLGHHQLNQYLPGKVGYGSIAAGRNLFGEGLYSLTLGESDSSSKFKNLGTSGLVLGKITKESQLLSRGHLFTFLGDLSEKSESDLEQKLSLFSVKSKTGTVQGKFDSGDAHLDLDQSLVQLDLALSKLFVCSKNSKLQFKGSSSNYQVVSKDSTLDTNGQLNSILARVQESQLMLNSDLVQGSFWAQGQGYQTKVQGDSHLLSIQTKHANVSLEGSGNLVSLKARSESSVKGSNCLVVGMGSVKSQGQGHAVIGLDHEIETDASLVVGRGGRFKPGLPKMQLSLNGKNAGFEVTSGGDDPEIKGVSSSFFVEHSGYKEILEWKEVPFSDPIGLFVTLNQGKLRVAGPTDQIVGVVAPQTGLVTGTREHQHLDVMGRPVTKTDYRYSLDLYLAGKNLPLDDTVQEQDEIKNKYHFDPYPVQINSNEGTDPLAQSKPRAGAAVALMGRVRVKCTTEKPMDQTWSISVGENGSAVPGDTYPVLKHVSSGVVEILLK